MVNISSSSESQQLSYRIGTALDAFQRCQNVATKNTFIRSQLSKVNSVNDKFRKLTEQSIRQADHVALYMNQLANYAKFVTEPDVANGESLQGAHSLLRQAQRNKQSSTDFASKYQQIIDELRSTREALEGHTEVIDGMRQEAEEQEDQRRECSQAGETKRAQRDENISNVKSEAPSTLKAILPTAAVAIAPEILPIILSALALDLGVEFVMDKLFDRKGMDIFGIKSTGKFVFNSLLASLKTVQAVHSDLQVWQIQKTINRLHEQLENSFETIDYLCDHIQAIIDNLSEFEGFWSAQETKLEYIITTLESSKSDDTDNDDVRFLAPLVESMKRIFKIVTDSEIESTMSRFDAQYIRGLCSNLEFRCSEYSRITRKFLNRPIARIE